MTTFPQTIVFASDNNEAKFLELIPKSIEARYQYTKSKEKLNMKFTTTLSYLKQLYEAGLVEVKK